MVITKFLWMVLLWRTSKNKPSTVLMAQLHSHLSDESYQYDSDTDTHTFIVFTLLFPKGSWIHFLQVCCIK